MPGAVTISTNMAGRGVDIRLGGDDESLREAATARGGLYVIGTNRHESIRIDRQLRGRAGRQGDPGASRFFISLEDDLFERYGLTGTLVAQCRLSHQENPILNGSLDRGIAHAQRIIEGQNLDIRRSLYKFSSLVELQRQAIHARRDEILSGPNVPQTDSNNTEQEGIDSLLTFSIREPALYGQGLRRFGLKKMAELECHATLFHLDRLWANHLAWIQDTRDSIHLVSLGGREPIDEFLKWAMVEFTRMQGEIDDAAVSEMTSIVLKDGPVTLDMERLKGPSSTWTYLLDENQFGWGIEMVKAKKCWGFSTLHGALRN